MKERLSLIVLVSIFTVIIVAGVLYNPTQTSEVIPGDESAVLTWEDGWSEFLPALIQVESHGDPTIEGANGDRGILQITPILVKEVNRISGMNYTHNDAWDPDKSIEMFYIIARKYCPEQNFEKMARIWNGGPRGCHKPHTVAYWEKVKREMKINKIS